MRACLSVICAVCLVLSAGVAGAVEVPPDVVDLGVIRVPAIQAPVLAYRGAWALSYRGSVLNTSDMSQYLSRPDVYAVRLDGSIDAVINGVVVSGTEPVKVVNGYDLSLNQTLNLPVYPTGEGSGSFLVWFDHPYGRAFRFTLEGWRPSGAFNPAVSNVVQGLQPVSVSVEDLSRNCSLIRVEPEDGKSVEPFYAVSPVCWVRFLEYPDGLTKSVLPRLGGVISATGSYPLRAELAVYDADGVRHVLGQFEGEVIVSAPEPIQFFFEYAPQYTFLGSMGGGEGEILTTLGETGIGRIVVSGAQYPGFGGMVVSIGDEEHESVANRFYVPVTTNISTLWGVQTVTVRAWYFAVPDLVFTKQFVFRAVADSAGVYLDKPSEAASTKEVIITGRVGQCKYDGTNCVYDALRMGEWRVTPYLYRVGESRDDARQAGQSVVVDASGEFSISLGQLEQGVYRVYVLADPVNVPAGIRVASLRSGEVTLLVRDGSAVGVSVRAHPVTGEVPFAAYLMAQITDAKRFVDVSGFRWQVSQDGENFVDIEGENRGALRVMVNESGVRWYRVVTKNRWSGEEYYSEAVSVQGFRRLQVVIGGPNATIVGHPVNLRAVVQNADSNDGFVFEWTLPDGQVFSGDALTVTPQEVGSYLVQLRAWEAGAPEGDRRTVVTVYHGIHVAAPVLGKPVISGLRYVESGKEYVYRVSVPSVVSPLMTTDLRVLGKWVLPDGREIPGADEVSVVVPDVEGTGTMTIRYEAWIEQYPEIRSEGVLTAQVWRYMWPDWTVQVRAIDRVAPTTVQLIVVPSSIAALGYLGNEKISYEWIMPDGVTVLQASGSGAVVQVSEPGEYVFTARVTDTRGNEAVVASGPVLIEPSPPLEGRMVVTVTDKWNRAPTKAYVQTFVTSMPKNDVLEYVKYSVDGQVVIEKGGMVAVVDLLSPGDHEIVAELHTKNGNVGAVSSVVTVVEGVAPVCRIEEQGDGVMSLYLRANCEIAQGYIAGYEWTVEGFDVPFRSQVISFAKSDLDRGIGCVRLVAYSDKGQASSGVLWGSCRK